jgi:hypothetical protein
MTCRTSDLLDQESDSANFLTEAEVIAVWLGGLADKDRDFVLEQVEATCAFLSQRREERDL